MLLFDNNHLYTCYGTEKKIEKELCYIRNFSLTIVIKNSIIDGIDCLKTERQKYAIAQDFALDMYNKALFMDDEVLHIRSAKVKKCLRTYCDIVVEYEGFPEKFTFYSDELHDLNGGETYYSTNKSVVEM